MMKRLSVLICMAFALLFTATAANDSIFVQLKSGKVLAYEYAEYDTVAFDETYIQLRDTVFPSGLVHRVVFDRQCIKFDTGPRLVAFKLRGSDAGNEALLGRNFTAETENIGIGDTIRLCVPYLMNYKLVPYFVANSHKTKVFIDGEEIISEETPVDFTNPVTLQMVASDGTVNEFVVVVENSGLPIVVVDTGDGKDVGSKTVWKERSSMVIYNSDGSINYDSGTDYMNIRGRGNSTWGYAKKPYNIKLNVKKSVLGMPKHKRWCLLANYIDRTLIRNAVAFELAKMTCMDWTPNGRFVELILNGKPLGNYYLCEAIRIDNDRVNVNEMTINDTSGDAITGGYLLELDSYYDAEYKFRTSYFRMPVNIKQPDEDEINNQQYNYIKNYFNSAERSLYGGSLEGFGEYIDLNSLIDWYLLNEAIYNPELGHPKSSYMHKDKNGKLFMGPAWDHDWETFTPHSSLRNNNAMWFGTLFQHKKFKDMVKERWNKLKGPFASVAEYIETVREDNRISWEFNRTLWPSISNGVNGDTSLPYDAAVNRLKSSFLNRLKSLDAIINSW